MLHVGRPARQTLIKPLQSRSRLLDIRQWILPHPRSWEAHNRQNCSAPHPAAAKSDRKVVHAQRPASCWTQTDSYKQCRLETAYHCTYANKPATRALCNTTSTNIMLVPCGTGRAPSRARQWLPTDSAARRDKRLGDSQRHCLSRNK